MLKKQFKERDVQRLRNLVTHKYGNKTTQGIGYTKPQEFHNEGDEWEEDGRKWTIKNGLKQIENTITYLTRQQNQDVKEGIHDGVKEHSHNCYSV